MSIVNELNLEERHQYCQRVYEDCIVYTAEFIKSCDEIAELLRTHIPSGCYTNFRDMLFHFRCMSESTDKNSMDNQVVSILEHSNRAIRDAEVALCVRCASVSRMLLIRYQFSKEVTRGLRKQIDGLEDCVLRLRMGSMMLDGMDILHPSVEDFNQLMYAYFDFIRAYMQDQYKDVLGYIYALQTRFGQRLHSMFNGGATDEIRNLKAFTTYNDVANIVYESVYRE